MLCDQEGTIPHDDVYTYCIISIVTHKKYVYCSICDTMCYDLHTCQSRDLM